MGATTSTSPASDQQPLSPGGASVEELEPCLSLPPRSTVKFLKCLSRASREQAGKKLADILDVIVSRNDHTSWERLLLSVFVASDILEEGGVAGHWLLL